jgi:hypothetical protein
MSTLSCKRRGGMSGGFLLVMFIGRIQNAMLVRKSKCQTALCTQFWFDIEVAPLYVINNARVGLGGRYLVAVVSIVLLWLVCWENNDHVQHQVSMEVTTNCSNISGVLIIAITGCCEL